MIEITPKEQAINDFLSTIFYDILRLEGDSINAGPYNNLSVNEMHILDAISQSEHPETMSELAARLRITASTLTIAVKTLEKKGFLVRERAQSDKRKVFVCLTDIARDALLSHTAFHEDLIRGLADRLTPEQMSMLLSTLSALQDYFQSIRFNKNI